MKARISPSLSRFGSEKERRSDCHLRTTILGADQRPTADGSDPWHRPNPHQRWLSQVSRGSSVAIVTEGGVASRARPGSTLIGYGPVPPSPPPWYHFEPQCPLFCPLSFQLPLSLSLCPFCKHREACPLLQPAANITTLFINRPPLHSTPTTTTFSVSLEISSRNCQNFPVSFRSLSTGII